MGKMSRTKGHSYERHIARVFREIGYKDAIRELEYQANTVRGVDLKGTFPYAIQCKRMKKYAPISKIEEVKACEGEVPLLITKGDRKKDIVCLYLEDFLKLINKENEQ